jgi:hypothetical protein
VRAYSSDAGAVACRGDAHPTTERHESRHARGSATPPSLTLVSAWLGAQASQPAKRPITFADFAAVKAVADPQVSPDGRTVRHALRTTDVEANRRTTITYVARSPAARRARSPTRRRARRGALVAERAARGVRGRRAALAGRRERRRAAQGHVAQRRRERARCGRPPGNAVAFVSAVSIRVHAPTRATSRATA